MFTNKPSVSTSFKRYVPERVRGEYIQIEDNDNAEGEPKF